mmetsp:Transcript_21062/g.28324  ORF Transcript_21062/g.28324 Transcript_21062/m.28324 type:complete len:93 (-) Transcript_21062:492-770(-)
MFFSSPGTESPDRLYDAKTPNQSLVPVSRQESATQNQVDPVLLANKLADIPEIGSTLLPSAAQRAAAETPPYGAAAQKTMLGGSSNLFSLHH